MASSKYYAYYIRGRQLAIVQHDYTLGSGQTLSQPGLNSVGARGDVLWKSPTEAITDGIEIEYAYSPRYRIESIAAADKETASSYETASGYLRFNGTGFSTESTVDYIVVSGSERWNGLHKVTGLNTAHYTTATKYSGNNVTETPTIYTNIDALNDESDTIDLPEYLTKALVYYVKAKLSEDRGEIEQKEYNMREFKRLLERNENAKVWGARRIGTGETAIK
tara:strand:+ start:41 stop:706 length:666 start_codon:yes stop_codon:yes gene_type:complete